MAISTHWRGLFGDRFARNFLPLPAASKLAMGYRTPNFELLDVKGDRILRLSDYWGKQPVVLAFTRIFTEKQYCPLCYPHIKQLNESYARFQAVGAEVLMVTSTDKQQTQQIIKDLHIQLPLLCNPACDVFRGYGVGQALGAPLAGQFVLDGDGKLRYKHLFSFIDHNATVERLLFALSKTTA
ncbi:MAG: redoxin domain-containing protein [Chloroflexaceae bacterium]|nr:redoxin domain-containing protein [Chloroflexaceae bacterium]